MAQNAIRLPVLALPLAALLALSPTPAAGTPSLAPEANWRWPIPSHVVVGPYLAPATPYGPGHRGIDIAGAAGEPVRAVDAGTVRFAGVVVDRPVRSITHAGGLISTYEPVVATVRAGDPVTAGQRIGRLEPGHCAIACLHLGARLGEGYLNPMLFLGGLEYSVLWPRG